MKVFALFLILGPLAAQPLTLPELSEGKAAAGRRVAVTAPEYVDTIVHHMLYLPSDWAAGKSYPLIVELTGNYFPASGSTGEVKDAGLGFGLTDDKAIWLTLPYISKDGLKNEVTWWGDTQATIDYALKNVPRVCQQFGADPKRVILCGFSRGAIGVSYLGLHNDKISKLWTGFMTHDHFDGVREWRGTNWGFPLKKYQAETTTRLERIGNRPVLICQNNSTKSTREFLTGRISLEKITFLNVPVSQIFPSFPNKFAMHPHTDRWLLLPSTTREAARQWFQKSTQSR